MSVMSYCAIEVLANDLQTVVDKFSDAIDEREYDWNEYEMRALPRLIEQCQQILNMYDVLMEECEFTGEPEE